MNSLISVIVPAYNSEQFIGRCISSIMDQSYHNLELIIIDDGSKDNTLKICADFAEQDERIHIFSIPNGGPAHARNLGISHAEGDWVMFVDSDDALEKDACLKLYNAAIQGNADVAFCNLRNISQGKIDNPVPYKGNYRIFEGPDKQWLEKSLVGKITETGDSILCLSGPVCKIIRKEIARKVLFPEDISLGEDTCFCLDALSEARVVVYISDCLYNRYCRTNSLSSTKLDTAERLVKYTNWVIDKYYAQDEYKEAVKSIVGQNLCWILIGYCAPTLALQCHESEKYWDMYISAQKIQLTYRDILHINLGVKRKIILILFKLHLYRLIYWAVRVKSKWDNSHNKE